VPELRPTHPTLGRLSLARKLEEREIRKSKVEASKGVTRTAVPDTKASARPGSEARRW
jgi:hypothetical protein